jgi:hypothetical protein
MTASRDGVSPLRRSTCAAISQSTDFRDGRQRTPADVLPFGACRKPQRKRCPCGYRTRAAAYCARSKEGRKRKAHPAARARGFFDFRRNIELRLPPASKSSPSLASWINHALTLSSAGTIPDAKPRWTNCPAGYCCSSASAALVADRSIDTRPIAACAVGAWPIAAGPVHARPIASRPVDLDDRSPPTSPAHRTAPAQATAPVIATPIPAPATPAVLVPTIPPTLPVELDRLHDRQLIRGHAQADRSIEHGGPSSITNHRGCKGEHGGGQE